MRCSNGRTPGQRSVLALLGREGSALKNWQSRYLGFSWCRKASAVVRGHYREVLLLGTFTVFPFLLLLGYYSFILLKEKCVGRR